MTSEVVDGKTAWLRPWGSTSIFSVDTPARPVALYDTTLRDGEQQAGVIFSVEQKVEIFRAIERANITYIETGMIAASPEEAEVVRRIASDGHTSGLYVLSRSMESDIDVAAKAGVDGVTMEILANPVLADAIFGWSTADILQKALTAARHARQSGIFLNFFLIDASRTPMEWTLELVGTLAAEHLLDAVTLADTFGVASPQSVTTMIGRVVAEVDVPVHIHAHNDFGMGVANALAAFDAGAGVAQGTLNGLGERAGNADLAHIAAALQLMRGWPVGVDFKCLRAAAQLIASSSGVPLPPNYPVLGSDLFDIEAGIAAAFYAGALERDVRYFYPFLPEQVGAEARIVLGKGVGVANVKLLLKEHGCTDVPEETLRAIVGRVKDEATRARRLLTSGEFADICRRAGVELSGT